MPDKIIMIVLINMKNMKNKVQIYSIIILLLYFTPKLLKLKGFTENIWYDIICFIAIISLAFFESKSLLKLDKQNNTTKFKKRLLLVFAALILLIVGKIYL
jgi:hypothetical protein